MGEPHVVSALVRKRAELAGEIAAAEKRIAQLRADLVHIDAALRIFDPEYRVQAIRPKRPAPRDEHFAPGELARLTLDTLRTAPVASGGSIARPNEANTATDNCMQPFNRHPTSSWPTSACTTRR